MCLIHLERRYRPVTVDQAPELIIRPNQLLVGLQVSFLFLLLRQPARCPIPLEKEPVQYLFELFLGRWWHVASNRYLLPRRSRRVIGILRKQFPTFLEGRTKDLSHLPGSLLAVG